MCNMVYGWLCKWKAKMTGPELDALIVRAERGIMNSYEQRQLAEELKIYRAMALRLERCVHELVKEAESCL